jgi:hypothetical protein
MARTKKPNPVLAALKSVGLVRVIMLSSAGLAGAVFALLLAISGIARLGNPAVALALVPGDGVALGAQADLLILTKPTDPPPVVRTLAMDALRDQGINPRALRVLGYYTEATGEFADAERLILMAQTLSRRESGAQMWLVEANARRNDTKQTLIHYDRALRVRPDNQTILFPRLAAAIEDTEIRAALTPYISAKNGWGEMFLADAIAKNANTPALARLMIDSGGVPDKAANLELQTSLLGQLVDGGFYQDARQLYLSMKGASAKRLTSGAFDPADRTAVHGPIGWQTINDVDGGGGFTGAEGESELALEIFTNAANTRLVTRKLLFLKLGTYAFAANLTRLESDTGGYLRWQLRCMQGVEGTAVWAVQGAEKVVRSQIAVPANCSVQLLELIASGGQGQSGIEATIRSVTISPQS